MLFKFFSTITQFHQKRLSNIYLIKMFKYTVQYFYHTIRLHVLVRKYHKNKKYMIFKNVLIGNTNDSD